MNRDNPIWICGESNSEWIKSDTAAADIGITPEDIERERSYE